MVPRLGTVGFPADALAVAELFQFLKNVTADLRQQIDGKIQPAATFSPAKPEGERVAA